MQEEAQVLLESKIGLFYSWKLVACILYYFQPRMRGWFPRRCAVEAVDHYDSCQVTLWLVISPEHNFLTASFHSRWERERIAVKKQIKSLKRKAEKPRR